MTVLPTWRHGHGSSSSQQDGLSLRSFVGIALTVFILLSTLDLERRLHARHQTEVEVEDQFSGHSYGAHSGRGGATRREGSSGGHPREAFNSNKHKRGHEDDGRASKTSSGDSGLEGTESMPSDLITIPLKTTVEQQAAGEGENVDGSTASQVAGDNKASREDEPEAEQVVNSAEQGPEVETHSADPRKEVENVLEEPWNTEEEAETQTRQPVHTAEKQSVNSQVHQHVTAMKEKAVLKAEKEAHDDEQRRNALKQDALASAAEAGRGDEVCDFCNNRGYCKEDNSGCLCTALWNGEKCDTFAVIRNKPSCMDGFKSAYTKTATDSGDIVMTSMNMMNKTEITSTRNPAKKMAQAKLMDVTPKVIRSLPVDDPLHDLVFKTCAVVGSSGILLMYEQGEAIDKHEAVFRFNSAPTIGFEKHVGSRTTIRITNTRNFGFREHSSELVLQHMRVSSGLHKMLSQRRKKPDLQLYGLSPDFHHFMDQSFSFLSTSGLLGIVLALHKCAKVDLYGFQVHQRHGVQYHYYNAKDKPANEGRDDTEWLAVKSFATSELVEFAEPCIIECHTSELWCTECQTQLAKQHQKTIENNEMRQRRTT